MQVQQIIVTQLHQCTQCPRVPDCQPALKTPEKPLNEKVIFEQAAPAAPFEAAYLALANQGVCRFKSDVHCVDFQAARSTIISLIFPMAFVGLSPLGHTSTQFMMERQRNSR